MLTWLVELPFSILAKKYFNFSAFTLLTWMSLSANSVACSCTSIPLDQKVLKSDYIYFGQVISGVQNADGSVANTLEVQESIKGNPDTLILLTPPLNRIITCWASADVGLTYVVFGKVGVVPTISHCSWSFELEADSKHRSRIISELKEMVSRSNINDS